MINRTYRSLDEPPKLLGFTIGQWCALILGAGMLLALAHVTHLPARVTITLSAFLIGLPATLAYLSESGGTRVGRLLWAAARWRVRPKELAPGERERETLHVLDGAAPRRRASSARAQRTHARGERAQ